MTGIETSVGGHRGAVPPEPVRFTIDKGLDVRVSGDPVQRVDDAKAGASVAWLADDYPGLEPEWIVADGEQVRLGDPVVRDATGYVLTAPGGGTARRVLGVGRALAALEVELDDPHACAAPWAPPAGADGVAGALLASGLWTALRARPFGRVADPAARPRSIFVTAIDTEPLAPRPDVVLAGREPDFDRGVHALTELTDGAVHVCAAADAELPVEERGRVRVHRFRGPHPAGLPGTHVHLLDPVGRGRTVWHVGYADVAALGRLLAGELTMERVVSLAGPRVARPRLLRTRLGASVDGLTEGELVAGECRVVSGSVLSGRQATGWGRHLGRYHRAVCALAEPRSHPARPPLRAALASALGRRLGRPGPADSTELHGRPTAMVPSGVFERLVPLDVLPSLLLRALLVGDVETAEALGCLELEPEDLALCTFACPGKLDYGAYLRAALARLREAA